MLGTVDTKKSVKNVRYERVKIILHVKHTHVIATVFLYYFIIMKSSLTVDYM